MKVTNIYGTTAHLFRLGDGCNSDVALELEICALTMKKGEKCELKTKDNKWEVELLSFEREKKLWKMSSDEVYNSALELKTAGNIALQRDKLELSRLYYLRSIGYLDGISKTEQNAGTNALSVACNSNLAIVCYRQENYVASVSHATQVRLFLLQRTPHIIFLFTTDRLPAKFIKFSDLKTYTALCQVLWLDANNVKALYRRAKVSCSPETISLLLFWLLYPKY